MKGVYTAERCVSGGCLVLPSVADVGDFFTGEGGRGDRQDNISNSHRALPGHSTAGVSGNYSRKIGRLFDRCGLLNLLDGKYL